MRLMPELSQNQPGAVSTSRVIARTTIAGQEGFSRAVLMEIYGITPGGMLNVLVQLRVGELESRMRVNMAWQPHSSQSLRSRESSQEGGVPNGKANLVPVALSGSQKKETCTLLRPQRGELHNLCTNPVTEELQRVSEERECWRASKRFHLLQY